MPAKKAKELKETKPRSMLDPVQIVGGRKAKNETSKKRNMKGKVEQAKMYSLPNSKKLRLQSDTRKGPDPGGTGVSNSLADWFFSGRIAVFRKTQLLA